MKYYLEPLTHGYLTNPEVAELATRIVTDYGTLPPADPLTNAAPLEAYIQMITTVSAKFDTVVNRILKNADTSNAVKRDALRDNAVSSFSKSVKVPLTSDLPAEVEHAQRLMIVVDAYRGVCRLSYEVETKALDTMYADLTGPVYVSSVEALGLRKYVDRIARTNADFKELFTTRITSQALADSFDAHSLRLELADLMKQYATFLLAMANATNDGYFIQHLQLVNASRKYYNDQVARRQGLAKAAAKRSAAGPQAN